jgi:hypothetical protein
VKKVHKQLENIRREEQYENAEPNRKIGVFVLRAGYRIGISQ